MNHPRAGLLVLAAHALLLVLAWWAGPGRAAADGDGPVPLQVQLLSTPPSPQATAVPKVVPPRRAPPAVALAAPPVLVAVLQPTAVQALPAAAVLAAPLPIVEPPPPAETPAPSPAEARLTLAQADHQRCPRAPHPAALRDRGIEGVVHLRVRVGVDGLPAEVNVSTGSGWLLLDQAALAQARGCRFLPARRGSEAVESWVEFPVRFVLKG